MGNDNSSPLPPPPSDALTFFTITFSDSSAFGPRDSLLMNYCRESEISLILEAAKETYPPGVQRHEPQVNYGYQIKLKGWPFEATLFNRNETPWTRNFLSTMLLKLGRKGWIPYVQSDLRRMGDTTTIIMQYKPEWTSKFSKVDSIAVVGIHCVNKLQLINVDKNLVQILLDVVSNTWQKEVSMKEKQTDSKNGFDPKTYTQLKMDGDAWGLFVNEKESVFGRLTILKIIEAMEKQGWILLANFNVRPTTDTLFFVKDETSVVCPDGGTSMFGMGLHKTDELRIVGSLANDSSWQLQVTEALSKNISEIWPDGLKRSEQMEDFYVLEMHGSPWWADGTKAVQSRLMVGKMLESLLALGWMVKCTVDCSTKVNDKNAFLFQRCNPVYTSILVISFNESDKIRAINCPKEIQTALDGAISQIWTVQRQQEYGGSYEWKLEGNPWDWGHWQNKALCLFILYELDKQGYTLIASADVSAKYIHQQNGPDYPLDVHSWFLIPKEADEKRKLSSGGIHKVQPYTLAPPPPYAYFAPSPHVTPNVSPYVSPQHSRSGTPDPSGATSFEPSAPPPPVYAPYGMPQWGNSLYPKL